MADSHAEYGCSCQIVCVMAVSAAYVVFSEKLTTSSMSVKNTNHCSHLASISNTKGNVVYSCDGRPSYKTDVSRTHAKDSERLPTNSKHNTVVVDRSVTCSDRLMYLYLQ